MDRYLNRKAFVTTLGAAGLGVGLTASALGGSGVRAQGSEATPALDEAGARVRWDEMHAELYAAFTVALGEELGIANTEVDGGIRAALATVVDGFAGDDLLTPGQATAVKALIETIDAPVGPGPMLGQRHAVFFRAVGPEGGSAPPVVAIAAQDEAPAAGPAAMAERFYPDFTAALATELGVGSADEVDGSIRLAMMAAIDGLSSDDLPMPIPTDALKAMIATAESPLGPGLLFGPHPGMVIRAFHGHWGDGPGFLGRNGDHGWFGERGDRIRDIREDRIDAEDEAESEDDAAADEDDGDEPAA